MHICENPVFCTHNLFTLLYIFSTPKSSKSCKKIRSAQLYTPSQRVGNYKVGNRIHETSQILLEACEVLLEARNYLRNVIKEFNQIINLREELLSRLTNTLKEETNVSVLVVFFIFFCLYKCAILF